MKREGALSLWAIVVLGTIGAMLGALLLIITPGDTFLWVVPWLFLIATVQFAFEPYLLRQTQQRGVGSAGVAVSAGTILAVSIYGGYVNGGLGVVLLAAFGFIGHVHCCRADRVATCAGDGNLCDHWWLYWRKCQPPDRQN